MNVTEIRAFDINGFTVTNNTDKQGAYPKSKNFLVFHPVYDGENKVFEADTRKEAVEWCNKESSAKWLDQLL